MTLTKILEQARSLSIQERKELVKLLVDTLDTPHKAESSEAKTGKKIAALLAGMEPIELVDPEITDPVEWVKVQRLKETNRLQSYREDNE